MPNRERITISVDIITLQWIDKQIEEGKFYNRSHAFENTIKERIRKK